MHKLQSGDRSTRVHTIDKITDTVPKNEVRQSILEQGCKTGKKVTDCQKNSLCIYSTYTRLYFTYLTDCQKKSAYTGLILHLYSTYTCLYYTYIPLILLNIPLV